MVERRLRTLEEQQRRTDEKIDFILQRLARYEGGWGMLMMVIAALWAAVALFKEKISNLFSG